MVKIQETSSTYELEGNFLEAPDFTRMRANLFGKTMLTTFDSCIS